MLDGLNVQRRKIDGAWYDKRVEFEFCAFLFKYSRSRREETAPMW